MEVSIRNYSFPIREELGIWRILWEQLSASEGYVRLQATIFPNLDMLIDYVASKGYLKGSLARALVQASIYNVPVPADADTVKILNGIISFCKSKKQVIKKRSFSWITAMAFDWGNTTRTDKCMKAVKKNLTLDGDDTVCQQLIQYLKSQKIIEQ